MRFRNPDVNALLLSKISSQRNSALQTFISIQNKEMQSTKGKSKTAWVSPFAHMTNVNNQHRQGLRQKETKNGEKMYDWANHCMNY
jgi:hypothetical protein